MSDCDSTAPVAQNVVPPVVVPDTSQAIAIIPLPEDLQFDIVSVEHENDESIERTPNCSEVRMSYTIEYKINVLDWYHAHGENKRQTAQHFGVDRKRIRDWLKAEQQLRAEPPSNMQRRKKNTGGAHYKPLDQAMLMWCKKQRMEGKAITNHALRAKALELAPQLGYQDTFKASLNWAVAWRRRNPAIFTHGNNQVAEVAAEKDSRQCNTNPEVIHEVPHGPSRTPPSTFKASLDTREQQVRATSTASTQTIDQREHEQWIALIEQTVDTLAKEVHAKIDQIKLLVGHLKTSIQQFPDACASASDDQPEPSPSKPANRASKRPLTIASTKAVVAKRTRKT